MLYSRTSLLIPSKHSGLHLLTPNSQSIPLPPPPCWQPQVCFPCLWTLSRFCRQVHLLSTIITTDSGNNNPKILNWVPMLYSKFLLIICFTYDSVYRWEFLRWPHTNLFFRSQFAAWPPFSKRIALSFYKQKLFLEHWGNSIKVSFWVNKSSTRLPNYSCGLPSCPYCKGVKD